MMLIFMPSCRRLFRHAAASRLRRCHFLRCCFFSPLTLLPAAIIFMPRCRYFADIFFAAAFMPDAAAAISPPMPPLTRHAILILPLARRCFAMIRRRYFAAAIRRLAAC